MGCKAWMEPQNLLTISIRLRDEFSQRNASEPRGAAQKNKLLVLLIVCKSTTIMSSCVMKLLLISSTLTCEVLRNLNAFLPVRATLRVDRVINFILLQVPIQQEQFAVIHFAVIWVVCVAVVDRRRCRWRQINWIQVMIYCRQLLALAQLFLLLFIVHRFWCN